MFVHLIIQNIRYACNLESTVHRLEYGSSYSVVTKFDKRREGIDIFHTYSCVRKHATCIFDMPGS